MTINFIPNDPQALSGAPPLRKQDQTPDRPTGRSDFDFGTKRQEGAFDPGTPEFLFWQCREAAIAAVQAWEASAGSHTRWQGDRRKLPLLQDAGEDLNAFYDRRSFSFFHRTVGDKTFLSGASTDVVAHEVGHGLLDSIRPDFFEVNFLEVGAFHEAFGDCMAMLTALQDSDTRKRLLGQTKTLRARNFVETTAEELSGAIRLIMPQHNAAEPRHAFNTLQFQIPSSLPDTGGPGVLINEVHSFGQVFTGCFWDLIANLYDAGGSKSEAGLLAAAQLAGKILIEGIKQAVVAPRFLQSAGRAMVLADQSLHGGANAEQIRDAFRRHGIEIGSGAMVAPAMALEGVAPRGGTLAPTTKRDLRRRLRVPAGAKMSFAAGNVFGRRVVHALHTRPIPLGNIDSRLRGVVAMAHEPVMVGGSGGRAAVIGGLPHADDTETEVRRFVESLLDHGQIAEMPARKAPASRSRTGRVSEMVAPIGSGPVTRVTHEIRTVAGKKMLKRVCFHCFCARCR